MYVLDTNVLVAAFRSRRGASFLLLNAVVDGRVPACATDALMWEYQEVLGRDVHLRRFRLSRDEVDVVLGMLASRLKPITVHFRWRPALPDPKDEMILDCAINGMATAIVTFNTSDFQPAAARFGLEVERPGTVVRRLKLRSTA
jgi:putative PIN family toxin of toxin-antitoxin system